MTWRSSMAMSWRCGARGWRTCTVRRSIVATIWRKKVPEELAARLHVFLTPGVPE